MVLMILGPGGKVLSEQEFLDAIKEGREIFGLKPRKTVQEDGEEAEP